MGSLLDKCSENIYKPIIDSDDVHLKYKELGDYGVMIGTESKEIREKEANVLKQLAEWKQNKVIFSDSKENKPNDFKWETPDNCQKDGYNPFKPIQEKMDKYPLTPEEGNHSVDFDSTKSELDKQFIPAFDQDKLKNQIQALRYNSGKPDYTYIDYSSLEPMVRVLEYGDKKYTVGDVSGRNNWRKGFKHPIEPLQSLMRHLGQLIDAINNGDPDAEFDKESGQHLIGHILCNCMFYSKQFVVDAKRINIMSPDEAANKFHANKK